MPNIKDMEKDWEMTIHQIATEQERTRLLLKPSCEHKTKSHQKCFLVCPWLRKFLFAFQLKVRGFRGHDENREATTQEAEAQDSRY